MMITQNWWNQLIKKQFIKRKNKIYKGTQIDIIYDENIKLKKSIAELETENKNLKSNDYNQKNIKLLEEISILHKKVSESCLLEAQLSIKIVELNKTIIELQKFTKDKAWQNL